ncbi:MAG: hypothetical protein ACK41V_14530 [Acidovorax sp.]|uniref:hypothetical protein n=1 Tax=Acidovorax sp. TaxID=1872122 RepID=UPI00391AB9FB
MTAKLLSVAGESMERSRSCGKPAISAAPSVSTMVALDSALSGLNDHSGVGQALQGSMRALNLSTPS